MADELQSVARDLRAGIEANAVEGSTALALFANNYALTPQLRHTALILKLNYGRAEGTGQRAELERQMLELVDRIVADHEQRVGSAEVDAKEKAYTKVRQRYLEKQLPKKPVFVGEGLTKQYAGSDFRLGPVSLTLRLGEITAVVGQNAHGKTTLLRLVAGELRADQGTLSYPELGVDDPRIDWVRVKSETAYLPQELPRWHGSLADNLHYEAALHGILGADNEREVDYVIERLALREHLDKRWSELSGGYKLRFTLARVLVWKPKLLIMDEPLANLDVKAQSTLLQDIRDLAQSLRYPMAVLISSQHLHELEAVSRNIVFLRGGQVVYNGLVADIGAGRTYNAYELGTSTDLATLRRVLDDARFRDFYDNGVSYVIKTAREIDYRAVLDHLLAAGVEIEYFRDISRSTKRLFE